MRRTGREGDHLIDNVHTVNFKLQALVAELSETARLNWIWYIVRRPLVWVIARELGRAAHTSLAGTFYRGRAFGAGEKPRSRDDFYWRQEAWETHVSAGKCKQDRYHEYLERVLYLSSTIETAHRESEEPSHISFIQRFELGLPDLRAIILDHKLEGKFPRLHFLLLNSEFLPGESYLLNPYRATHLLAYLCACFEIDAIEYPSVKVNFKKNPGDFNLVLFRKGVESARDMMVGGPFEYRPI
ncbi:MAG TPA: RES domain-containing protein [Bryobacteraceae bacterium]|nr:RES domain-containing protein [Bryobacteraceae bacterium]